MDHGRVQTEWVQGKRLEWIEGTDARTCADGAGVREMLNGWGEAPVGISERGCADVCGRCGCKGKVGNGLGEGPVGMSERGCADVCARCGCKEKWEMGGEKGRWA